MAADEVHQPRWRNPADQYVLETQRDWNRGGGAGGWIAEPGSRAPNKPKIVSTYHGRREGRWSRAGGG
jgi:hypothetical protein